MLKAMFRSEPAGACPMRVLQPVRELLVALTLVSDRLRRTADERLERESPDDRAEVALERAMIERGGNRIE
jgi:hypothetical protein